MGLSLEIILKMKHVFKNEHTVICVYFEILHFNTCIIALEIWLFSLMFMLHPENFPKTYSAREFNFFLWYVVTSRRMYNIFCCSR